MLRVLAVLLIALTVAPSSWANPVAARFRSERQRATQALEHLRRSPGAAELRVDWPVHRTRPAAIRGLQVPTAGATDEARARAFLAQHPSLGVELGGGRDTLRLVDARRPLGIRALRFQLFHRGLEVLGATLVVALDDQARVTALTSEADPVALASIGPATTREAALASVRARLGASGRGGAVRLAILAEGAPRLVYRVRLPYPADPHLARYHLVDAVSGRYLGWRRTGVVEHLAGKEVRR